MLTGYLGKSSGREAFGFDNRQNTGYDTRMAASRFGHRGRVFYGYLFSFLVTLLVPVTMSFFVFNRAGEVIRRDAEQAADALIAQTKAYIDLVMDDVFQLNYLVSYNDRLESLIYDYQPISGDQLYTAYRLTQDFSEYRVATRGVVDFYVYFPNLEMVVSADGYFSPQMFHLARRSPDDEPIEAWLNSLVAVRRQELRPGGLALDPQVTTWPPIPTVEIVSPLPADWLSSAPRGFAVIQMREDVFDPVLAATPWSDETVFLVYHPEQGLISASDAEVAEAFLSDERQRPTHLAPRQEVTVAGVPYIAFTQRSRLDHWRQSFYYVLLIPRAVLTTQLNVLKRFTVVAFLLSIGVGIGLIYFIAVARYRPIRSLLKTLQPDADGTITLHSDELAMIRSSLQATLAEDRRLRQEVGESRPYMVQRFLQQLLKGTIDEPADVVDRLASIGLHVDDRILILALIEPDLVRRSRYPDVVAAVEGEVSPPDADTVVVRDLDGAVGLLHSFPPSSTPDQKAAGGRLFAERVARVKTEVEQKLGLQCAAGISDPHRLPDGFPPLLREARAALSYRLVKGSADPIPFAEVLTTGRRYYYPIDDENKLINSIHAGSYDAASKIVEHVFDENFAEGPLSVEMARLLMFDLTSTMTKALNALPLLNDDGRFWADLRPISRLTDSHSLAELRTAIDEILQQVCGRVKSERCSHSTQLCADVDRVVDANLHDRNLGPESIADEVGKNAAYLSRVYREERGEGISRRIKSRRVAEAQRLLSDTDVSVREVAQRLGFVDSNALIRAFKDIHGVTPGDFRDSVRAQVTNTAPSATNVRN